MSTTSKLKLAASQIVSNRRKNSLGPPKELEKIPPREHADCNIHPSRLKSRRWKQMTKPRGVPSEDAKIVAAESYGLIEDSEDVIDYVDVDQTPEAIDRRTRATTILAKPPGQRTVSDIEFLCNLVRGVYFFEKRTNEERSEVVRELTLRNVAAYEKVVPIGSKASCLYVILQGAARLYMPIDEEDEEALPSQDEGVSANLVNTHVLEDGDSFGEQGLRTARNGSDHTRKFEVIAAIPSLLLVLERSDYQKALTRLRENMLRDRANLLRRVFAFSDWQEEDLRRLAEVVTERHFDRGVAIVQQGKRALDCMFFLVRGECRVLRQVDVSAVQQEMLAVTSDLLNGKAETGQLTPRGAAANKMSPVLLEVGSLKSHEHPFFGESAMADRGTPLVYASSILTSTPVLCLSLSKYDFIHQIDTATQALILGFSSTHDMDDHAIRASIAKTFSWEVEKRKALGHVIAESAERRRLESPRLNGRMEPKANTLTPRTGTAG